MPGLNLKAVTEMILLALKMTGRRGVLARGGGAIGSTSGPMPTTSLNRPGFAGDRFFKLCGHGWRVQHGVVSVFCLRIPI